MARFQAGPPRAPTSGSTTARDVVVGIVGTLVVLALAGFGAVELGLVPAGADHAAGPLERWAAQTALQRRIGRDVARIEAPKHTFSNAALVDGVKLYAANCAVCHGASDAEASTLARGFYVPSPMLAKDGVEDDAQAVTFWKLKHGIRWTAMPAFGDRLTDDQLWEITAFVSSMDALPAPVDGVWKRVPSAMLAAPAAPAAAAETGPTPAATATAR